MGYRRLAIFLSVSICGALIALGPIAQQEEPREIGLVEKVFRNLAQIDVTVTGPEAVIGELSAEDFELVVGGRFIEDFIVDKVCRQAQETKSETALLPAPELAAEQSVGQPAARTAPATYLFYFDHHHLKPSGRQNALDMAREMIPELVVDGNRALIVSAGEELVTFADMTSDVEELIEAVDRIEKDNRQWDQFPYQEELRISDVVDILAENDTSRAMAAARRYQQEERWRTEKALRLFSMVLGRLADLDPPKVAIYFADTMRSNAGEHYLNFFGQATREAAAYETAAWNAMELDSFAAGNPFDRVVEEAAAHGIRLYTIQAEGLVTASSLVRGNSRAASIPTGYISDAQDSLVSLAKETGGRSFLNGVRAAKIAAKIRTDLNCLYLLSFDPSGMPLDTKLPALVRIKRPKVKARARGTLMIQGESSRLTSRLMSAFVAPGAAHTDLALRGVVVPTGFSDGRYSALVQIAIPATSLANAEWDIGLSLVSKGKVREDSSSHLAVGRPGVPLIYETEITFAPGPYELIVVAHSLNTDQITTMQIDGEWPHPDDGPSTMGPIVVMQPATAAFLRGGEVRGKGALGKDDSEFARTDLPTALIGLICRSRSKRSILRVERVLSGDNSASFRPMELEFGEERCAQIRDLIPAGTMTEGEFIYEIRILDSEMVELSSSSHQFIAVDEPDSES
jgi:VWFA-related protein